MKSCHSMPVGDSESKKSLARGTLSGVCQSVVRCRLDMVEGSRRNEAGRRGTQTGFGGV